MGRDTGGTGSSSEPARIRLVSSCNAMLASFEFPFNPPILLDLLSRDSIAIELALGRRGRERQVSKQSAQHGVPSKSTIGLSPRSFMQPRHLKQLRCQYLPPCNTCSPSDLSDNTGLSQASHVPLDPPFSIKQSLHR
jgi:hypothetical protein